MIVKTPWWLKALNPTAIFRITDDKAAERLGMPSVVTPKGRVFITFDDGPVPEVTPWVLETLKSFGVKATFFMVGENVERYPEIASEVVRQGHKAANHAHCHRPGHKSTIRRYVAEAARAHSVIKSTCYNRKTVSRVFRPPHGFIRFTQLFALRLLGYSIVLFDVVSRDFDASLNSETIISNVLDNIQDGSIIVFHDSIKASPRLKEALPVILANLCSDVAAR